MSDWPHDHKSVDSGTLNEGMEILNQEKSLERIDFGWKPLTPLRVG